jgi:hypothetical protein
MTYFIDYTSVLPTADRDAGNHLAMVLGEGPGETLTYRENAIWTTCLGDRHIAGWRAEAGYLDRPITRPEWDTRKIVNLSKARSIFSKDRVFSPTEGGPTLSEWIKDRTEGVLFFEGVSEGEVMAAIGAKRVFEDE